METILPGSSKSVFVPSGLTENTIAKGSSTGSSQPANRVSLSETTRTVVGRNPSGAWWPLSRQSFNRYQSQSELRPSQALCPQPPTVRPTAESATHSAPSPMALPTPVSAAY